MMIHSVLAELTQHLGVILAGRQRNILIADDKYVLDYPTMHT